MLALAEAAARGRSGTLLISGEAGIGKTSLVRDVCAGRPAGVLWAPCLPLTSLAAPLLPLQTALRDEPQPVPLASVLEFDAWLDRRAADEPVLLVVDDLQWADQSSLDMIMYVIAGRADRRVAVLATLRSGEEGRLLRWLADVRRLPRVHELHLGRLDRVSTRDQLTDLLGRPPHESLVDDVHSRSHGNPYLTSLLVRGLSPDARALPPHLPTELHAALARSWHGLSPAARELTSRIAVAGRPQQGGPVELLRESVDAGVLQTDTDGRYWFAHPLLAEVLVGQLLPEERRALHADLAETSTDPIDRADHYHRAGATEPAYRWALKAADAAEANGGAAEAHRLLRRAMELRPADAEVSAVDLLHRIRFAARRACRPEDELPAVAELLDLLDPEAEPLTVAELLIARARLQFDLGLDFAGVADVETAEQLSAREPSSETHAWATAALAANKIWHDDATGRADSARALRLARAGGWPRALGFALVAHAMANLATGDLAAAAAAAHEALATGLRIKDFDIAVGAGYQIGNSVASADPRDFTDAIQRIREQFKEAGAPHRPVSEMCSLEAETLLSIGDWQACLDRLRVTLGARPSVRGDARSRYTAALLAARQGRHAEAAAHLARSEELIPESSDYLVLPFDPVRAELAVAAGDTEWAITCALRGLAQDPPSIASECLLPLAARALADRAESCRDRGADPGPELDRLRELRERYPEVITADIAISEHNHRWRRAMQELADAETARARRDSDEVVRWQRTAQACQDARVVWEQAYSRWREAQAALRDRSTRRQGAAALRRAYEMAVDLQATPLIADLELLARNAHVPTAAVAQTAIPAGGLPGLTAREREVLAHLVAGRTYSEIAGALVLSEKTVSAHISNMLRKTGTTSRIELAQLAQRQSGAHEPPAGTNRNSRA
ncbi:MAG: hypothetical protein QOE51_1274 [Actinoplanes sp.]|nr:hypothetical protein [Actinoplanes sp.]